jgi:hypothetical protein
LFYNIAVLKVGIIDNDYILKNEEKINEKRN